VNRNLVGRIRPGALTLSRLIFESLARSRWSLERRRHRRAISSNCAILSIC